MKRLYKNENAPVTVQDAIKIVERVAPIIEKDGKIIEKRHENNPYADNLNDFRYIDETIIVKELTRSKIKYRAEVRKHKNRVIQASYTITWNKKQSIVITEFMGL